MRHLVLILAAVAALAAGGCRTSPYLGEPDPVVAPRDWTPGITVTPEDCRCVTWRCGPDRGRLWRRWRVELEGGPVWQSKNDVAIPGDTGTRFALDDLTGAGPYPYGRVTVDYQIKQRHSLRAMVAPLELSDSGTLAQNVDFRGTTFNAGLRTKATYRFNSYRLTYRYLLGCGCDWSLHVGATAKIRDAKIELEQGGLREAKYDLGFVPLLHVAFEKRLSPRWRFLADADFAAAPQGRAIDFTAKLYYEMNDRWSLGFGYRTIEGGADNDSVYTFSWFHQAVAALAYRF
jgi:hypothetical protein